MWYNNFVAEGVKPKMLKKRFNSPNLNISNNSDKEHNGANWSLHLP
jgi:hypothetical protein